MTKRSLFNQFVTSMRNLPAIILAGVIGLVIGGALGLLFGNIEHHWEGGPAIMIMSSALVGATAGALSAAVCALPLPKSGILLKTFLGLCVGVGLSLPLGRWLLVNSGVRAFGAPASIPFWVVAVVVFGGGLAGVVGALIAPTNKVK